MGVVIAVFLLALLLAGLGFALHVLWWLAVVVLVVWLLGFALRGGSSTRRWYRW